MFVSLWRLWVLKVTSSYIHICYFQTTKNLWLLLIVPALLIDLQIHSQCPPEKSTKTTAMQVKIFFLNSQLPPLLKKMKRTLVRSYLSDFEYTMAISRCVCLQTLNYAWVELSHIQRLNFFNLFFNFIYWPELFLLFPWLFPLGQIRNVTFVLNTAIYFLNSNDLIFHLSMSWILFSFPFYLIYGQMLLFEHIKTYKK